LSVAAQSTTHKKQSFVGTPNKLGRPKRTP
jgi:hypothetical protein